MIPKRQIFSSTVPEKAKRGANWRAKRGTLWDFLTSIMLQNIGKIEAEILWRHEQFSKKKFHAEKKLKRGVIVSSGIVWYAKKEQLL